MLFTALLISFFAFAGHASAATWYFLRYYPASGEKFTSFSGEMTIPPLPKAGTYYLWPGLQPTDNSGVYQNVLDGRSGTWWIGSGGLFVHLTEAATMIFVAKNTSIPVPRVYCAFVHNNIAHIVMERIQGDPLSSAWKKLSEEDLESILSQLRHMLQELREIKPPPNTGVESCVGGSLQDPRMTRSYPRFGPFKTIQDFHSWLRGGLEIEDFPNGIPNPQTDHDWDDFQELVEKQKRPWPASVFTHGDLNPTNILVRGNKVVGIIDWEVGGWYPPYWEYTSACYLHVEEWRNTVPKFLEPYPEEFRMETLRQRWWGEI
ncbi:hypothetical protein Daesc_001197 [Daldinia eschscholtzii]|uniref:Aminoglycoside phosphotransferase domain-containing protein n=1 Tax=Daldinia eschscholtzii TaxID=292717 RepID=A0AAX6N0H7_9PEZI